jgi:hypothetical protein
LARPDAQVCLPAAVGPLGLRLPFLGEADNHPAAESLLGADHGAVRPVGPDMAGAIPEGLRGRTDEAAGKSAAREPRLADAGLEHPDPAWVLFPERPAWSVLEKHLAQPHAAEARCKRDAGLSAA